MQQPTESAPALDSTSFAGLLAALADPAHIPEAPSEKPASSRWRPAPAWNDDDLADDVATLSYESALKTHARYHPSQVSQVSDQSLIQPADAGPIDYPQAVPYAPQSVVPSTATLGATTYPQSAAAPEPESSPYRAAPFDRNLKAASITIRMSKAECAQLHRRADEAGLTVSAYLRSCTFEVESLRAMVKDTMAQLRAATTPPASAAPPRISRFRSFVSWLSRLLTPWQSSQRAVRA